MNRTKFVQNVVAGLRHLRCRVTGQAHVLPWFHAGSPLHIPEMEIQYLYVQIFATKEMASSLGDAENGDSMRDAK
jgi:hypothetical protein